MSKTLRKLKFQRAINSRTNGVVEQLEKILARLQKWVEKLDAEQDAAAEALSQEIQQLEAANLNKIKALESQIANAKQKLVDDRDAVRQAYGSIINESKAEADRARKVQENFQKLTS